MNKAKNFVAMSFQTLKKNELLTLVVILIVSILPRLVFISIFPSRFVSDFSVILRFGLAMTQDSLARGDPAWDFINPGTPFFLSLLFRMIPANPELVARWATALITGALPLIPFLFWRNVFSLRARTVSALLLALWPGQIIFSGIPAQDNWVLFPSILLCALCVRVLMLKENGYPFWGTVMYVLAGFIRQEMFVVLLPALFVVIYTKNIQVFRGNLYRAGTTLFLLLFLLIVYRGTATGHYTLSTSHAGEAMLGSYVPGAGKTWTDPKPYLAATAPQLLYQGKLSQKDALSIVWQEVRQRPVFHGMRLLSLPAYEIVFFDENLAYWSITRPDVLPTEDYKVNYFVTNVRSNLKYFSMVPHFLFFFAIVFASLRKKKVHVVAFLLLIMLMKIFIHVIIVSQARFFLTSIALEFLVIGVVLDDIFAEKEKLSIGIAILLTSISCFLLASSVLGARKYISTHDIVSQYHYRFPLEIGNMKFDCEMNDGLLFSFYPGEERATFRVGFLNAEPSQGEKVEVRCMASNISTTIHMNIPDYYKPGGLPDRIKQVLYINEKEVFYYDIADDAWSGVHGFTLTPTPQGTLSFSFQLIAVNPDPGLQWGGSVSQTTLELLLDE